MATQTIGNNPNPEARYILNDSAATGYIGTLNVNTSMVNAGNGSVSGTLGVTGLTTATGGVTVPGTANYTAQVGANFVTTVGSGTTTTFNAGGLLSSQAVAAGTATSDTNEDVLFTYTLNTSTLKATGQTLEIFAAGTMGTAAHTKTIKMYFGTAIFTLYNATGVSLTWSMTGQVTRLGSASALVVFTGTVGTAAVAMSAISDTDTLDSGTVVIKTTGQEATGANSGVTAYCQMIWLYN